MVYSFLRYTAALIVIFYGFAKLNGAQFTILESELDKPMREVSGFWLTWYYFGYSMFYGNAIGLIQVAGGMALLLRKTTLLATCLLLTVVSNIILIDMFYGIGGGLPAALVLEACLIGVASFHKDELIDLFWRKQNALPSEDKPRKTTRFAKVVVRSLIVILPAVFTYFVANYNNRAPTPIDGRWRVEKSEQFVSIGREPLTYVYFERNRAYMCVFKYGSGTWTTHHFEVDERTGKLEIWRYWLRKEEKIFTGRYQLDGGRLTLTGTFTASGAESVVELKK